MKRAVSIKDPLSIALIVIVCFHLINNFIWLAQDNSMFGFDVPNHLYRQSEFHGIFKELVSSASGGLLFKAGKFLRLMHSPMASADCVYWPNLLYLSSTILILAFGCSLFVLKSTMLLYLTIILFSTYAIGRKLGDRATGVLAAFFVSMYPLIFESSRQYGLDLPLTALVCLAFLLLLKTEYFNGLKYSMLLGITAGIAMLIKGQFLIFFAAPFLWAVQGCFLNDRPGKAKLRVFLNLSLFILIAVSIASVWWMGRVKLAWNSLVLHSLSNVKFLESGTVDRMYDWKYFLYNLRSLAYDSLGLVFTAIAVVSLVVFARSKTKFRMFFLLWIIVPVLLFSLLFVVKHERFLMPVLPALAVISAWGIQQLRSRRVKIRLIVILVLFAGSQYYTLSYFNYWYNNQYRFRRVLPVFGSSSYGNTPYMRNPFYNLEKLKITRKVVEIIAGSSGSGGDRGAGLVLINSNISSFEALYWMNNFDPRVHVIDWVENYPEFYRELPNLRYVIIGTYCLRGSAWPVDKQLLIPDQRSWSPDFKVAEAFPEWGSNFKRLARAKNDFELINTLYAENRFVWYIYKRKEINER